MMSDLNEIEKKIVKQIEYYFGDINLSRDTHMKSLASKDPEGYITFEEMLKFNRLATITKEVPVIKEALVKAGGLVQVNDRGMRRNPALPVPDSLKEAQNQYVDRSIYAKGFPRSAKFDELDAYYTGFGETLNLFMRRGLDKTFKGSVFVIFKEKEDADRYLSSQDSSKYKESDMIRMMQTDYTAGKLKQREESQAAQKERNIKIAESRAAVVRERMILGSLLELSGLPKTIVEEKKPTAQTDPSNGTLEKPAGDKESSNGDTAKTDAEKPNEKSTTLELKTWLSSCLTEKENEAQIVWLDLDTTAGTAIARFKTENSAATAWAAICGDNANTAEYKDSVLTGKVITGDQEFEHWKRLLDERARHRQTGGKRGGRGGYGGPPRKRQR